jgi:hypothetical protein
MLDYYGLSRLKVKGFRVKGEVVNQSGIRVNFFRKVLQRQFFMFIYLR